MIVQPARPLAFGALAYFAVGMASVVITNPIAAPGAQALLRVTALILGGVVFLAHVRHEVLVLHSASRKAAARSALGAAFGALLLAGLVATRAVGWRQEKNGAP